MIYFRKFKYATEMTVKALIKNRKNLFQKGNTPKDYFELFLLFYKYSE